MREKILRLSMDKIVALKDGECYHWTNAMVGLKGGSYFLWKVPKAGKVEEYCRSFELNELDQLFTTLKSMK